MKEENIDKVGELESMIPAMNVSVPQPDAPPPCIISDDSLLGIYAEIVDNLRDDRKEIDKLLANFVEMVINEGDSTSASKEALVNLVKIKSDTADKMSKIADLMTRIKLRDANTMPLYLAAKQENTININGTRRSLIKDIEKAQKSKGKNGTD